MCLVSADNDGHPHPSRRSHRSHSSRNRHASASVPLQQVQPPHPQQIPTLQDLGYTIELRGHIEVEGQVQSFYIIKQPNQLPYIAKLSIIDCSQDPRDAATLFVNYIDTNSDTRDGQPTKPRARQIFAAFWIFVNRDLRTLRRIYFSEVTNAQTRTIVHEMVCPQLQIHYDPLANQPVESFALIVPREGDAEDESRFAWDSLSESHLVKSAKGMPRRYPMAGPGENLGVVRLEVYQAFTDHGVPSAFDIEVVLGHRDA